MVCMVIVLMGISVLIVACGDGIEQPGGGGPRMTYGRGGGFAGGMGAGPGGPDLSAMTS